MAQPPDTQIDWQALKRISHRVETLTSDKEYNWGEFRRYLRKEDVKPVIKHREFSSLDAAHNARIDDKIYHRRMVVESLFASLRRRFDDTIRANTWFGQFREIVLKAAVKILKPPLSSETNEIRPLNTPKDSKKLLIIAPSEVIYSECELALKHLVCDWENASRKEWARKNMGCLPLNGI